jgi:hypothetical protein
MRLVHILAQSTRLPQEFNYIFDQKNYLINGNFPKTARKGNYKQPVYPVEKFFSRSTNFQKQHTYRRSSTSGD